VAERVVDRLEVVEIDEQGGERSLVAARTHHQLLDAIEDQGPVRKAGERVVRSEERELALAVLELLIRGSALVLEGLAHPHERHVEAALQHRERLRQHRRAEVELFDTLPDDLAGRVAPAQAPLCDLVQRRCALRGELAEYLPRLPPDLTRDLGALARHPAGDRDGRDGADARESLLYRRIQLAVRRARAHEHRLDHVCRARVERVPESRKLLDAYG
jgi:hypothetical protein